MLLSDHHINPLLSEVAYYPHATNEAINRHRAIQSNGTSRNIAEQVPSMQMSSSAPALMPITSQPH